MPAQLRQHACRFSGNRRIARAGDEWQRDSGEGKNANVSCCLPHRVHPGCELTLVPTGGSAICVSLPSIFRCPTVLRQFIARAIFLRKSRDLIVKTLCTVPNRRDLRHASDSYTYITRFESQ